MFSFLLAVGGFCFRRRGDKEGYIMEMRQSLVALKLWCRFFQFGMYVLLLDT